MEPQFTTPHAWGRSRLCGLAFCLFKRRPRPTIWLERGHAVVDF